MSPRKSSKPDLRSQKVIENLPSRKAPYWHTLEYCRHVGIEKALSKPAHWVARVRRKDGGYTQARLAPLRNSDNTIKSFDEAVNLAQQWFESDEVATMASTPFPIGVTQELRYTKSRPEFTVGDALKDYIEWKRIAATKAHFETNLSLINYHLIPRFGDLPATELNSRVVTAFCRDVLETPPKRGNQELGPRIQMENPDGEALRKRKKTVNTLIGILRLAMRMAWENGEIESDRVWRCIRRLPNTDLPRHIFLSRPQCRALLDVCRPDLRDLVKASLYSGCRVSELARMQVEDVGAGVFGIYVRPSKNGRARYVVQSKEGMSFFLHATRARKQDDLLFRMESGNQWRGGHKHLFKAAVREAGLPDSFVFHGLRHTYASQLVQAGTPLAVVAKQLGHASTDTVSRTYGHLCCESIEAHVERGFAPLDEEADVNDERLDALREAISLGSIPDVAVSSWPRSNFALASFVGPRK